MIKQSETNLRAAARWGVGAAIVVAIGSTIANMYTAAAHVAEGAGGWADLDGEGWLNVILNAGLALGSEAIGFLAFAFVLAFALGRRWANCAAAGAVFVVALIVNGTNTHDFVERQERQAALERVRQSPAWRQADLDKRAAEREIERHAGAISPKALREKLERLTDDRAAALREGRRLEARQLRDDIRRTRDDLAEAVSAAEAAQTALTARDMAADAIAELEGAAAPSDMARRRAWVILISIEVIKALGMLSFSLGDTPCGAHAPAVDRTHAPAAPKAARKPARPRAVRVLSIEEKRERQRAYTAKWRAGKAAVAG